jgi:uncharacterized repeat protein (TIGR01451 family)
MASSQLVRPAVTVLPAFRVDTHFKEKEDTMLSRPYRLLTIVLVSLLTSVAAVHPGVFDARAFAAYTTGDLTYHKGPVMPNPTNYAVFWLPSGQSFEPTGNAFTNANFESLVAQYFQDICPSNYYNILSLYSTDPANSNATVKDGPIQNACTYGGSYVDATAYPHAGTTADPLKDSDIQAAIGRARAANPSWGTGTNVEYFVYVGYQVNECAGTSCTYPNPTPTSPSFCAYHTDRSSIVYAFMSVGICTPAASAPNDQTADRALKSTSHEQFEGVSDPDTTGGWFNGDTSHENGDQCTGYYGSADVNADGTNFILKGHKYRVQWEWVNGIGKDQGGGDFGTTGCAPSWCGTSVCQAAPTLSLSASPAAIPGNPGDDIQYTITYGNSSGTDGAYNTTVKVTLPTGLSYSGTTQGPAPGQVANVLTYNTGTLGVGGSGTIVLHATPASALPNGNSYTTTVDFAGQDQLNNALPTLSRSTSTSIVNSPPAWSPISDQSVDYHDPLSFGVTATDSDAGDTLTLSASGLPAGLNFTDSGNRTGTVSGTVTGTPGTYVVTFTVNDGHNPPVDAKMTISVTREETTLTYTGDTVIASGSNTAHLSARLLEDGNPAAPVAGRLVNFTLGTAPSTNTCSGTTEPSGVASCTINPVTVPLGPQTVTANFPDGDTYYLPASDSKSVMIFAFLASGSFALGDTTVAAGTNPVTWWSDSWVSLNSLSGGSAPDAFKGFADTLGAEPPTCGASWTADPGNSGGPPATSDIPSYMGVLVTTSATKAKKATTGTISKIVVVKTALGYAPSPGHAGTGTIVATYCK